MLIGKPVSPSTRQPIPQPVHRQYPLRLVGIFLQLLPQQLQSTPPARARRPPVIDADDPFGFQSTPPARAATREFRIVSYIINCFNPRRPRGRRRAATPAPRRLPRFNPRRPRGRRPKDVGSVPVSSQFQSTPPARAATRPEWPRRVRLPVSIHAAREGGDFPPGAITQQAEVSIHAAREGGDRRWGARWPCRARFNPPARAAT